MVWRRLAKSAQEYVQRVKNPFFPPAEKDLYSFASPEDLRLWSVYSDASLGGNTSAALVLPTPPEVSEGVLNLQDFDTLAYRVRGDGRKYIASLRTENWLVDSMSQDVWQAFLFARKGEWAEVEVPLDRFLQTWKGRLVDTEEAMNPGRIVGLGISVAGSGGADDDGDFRLDLDWIRARRLHATF